MPIVKLQDNTRIYYEFHGEKYDATEPNKVATFIFMHGGPGLVDSRLYGFWKRFASENMRIMFIDQRGSGRSSDSSIDKLNIHQHAKDIYQLCRLLGISKPIVGGVSQGGYVALAYACDYPDDISALILCNTEAKRDANARAKAHEFSIVNYFGKSPAEAKEIARKLRDCDANWDAETYKQFLPYYAKNSYGPEEINACIQHPETWQQFMKVEFATFDLTPLLKKITCPVLHLAGEYDCVHPPASAKETVEKIQVNNKKVKLCIIPDAADPVYRDQEQFTEQAVRRFLKCYRVRPRR